MLRFRFAVSRFRCAVFRAPALLGAGEGADSIRLALLGYQVDAVEISAVAAEKISHFAEEAGAKVRVVVADIRAFIPDNSYDVIFCNGVLHYLDEKEQVVTRMQEATRPGGINVVSLWNSHTPVPECHESIPVFCDGKYGIVAALCQGWPKELLYFERDKAETSHSDLPSHRHSHIKLIARRPSRLDDAITPGRHLPAVPGLAPRGRSRAWPGLVRATAADRLL